MKIDLTGRTALVCGSTQGIGKESAIQLAKSGARVILAARNKDMLQKIKLELDSIRHTKIWNWLLNRNRYNIYYSSKRIRFHTRN